MAHGYDEVLSLEAAATEAEEALVDLQVEHVHLQEQANALARQIAWMRRTEAALQQEAQVSPWVEICLCRCLTWGPLGLSHRS